MGDPVKVIVGQGQNQQIFFVHKDLLSKHSDFFKTTLENGGKEPEIRTVLLPDEDPAHFEIFAGFLYTGQVFSSKDGDFKPANPPATLAADFEYMRLLQSWVLGEKLLSTSLKDACTDAFIAKISETKAHPMSGYTISIPMAQYSVV